MEVRKYTCQLVRFKSNQSEVSKEDSEKISPEQPPKQASNGAIGRDFERDDETLTGKEKSSKSVFGMRWSRSSSEGFAFTMLDKLIQLFE